MHPIELRCILLSFAAPFWATVHVHPLDADLYAFVQSGTGIKRNVDAGTSPVPE
jgi:hypothetical protein